VRLPQQHQVTGAFLVTVPLIRVDTPYVRVGDWPLWLAAAIAACTAGAAALRRAVCHRTVAPR
jgi:apolipoprotein N-acyltransferase